MYFRIAIVLTVLTISACSSWVYRYDIPQGNYLDKKSIAKLQVGMTKEQVKFILGSPVIVDAFNDDTWNYVYRLKSGRSERFDIQRKLVIDFVNDEVVSASGDYKLSENFNTPFNIDTVQESDLVGKNAPQDDVAEGGGVDAIASEEEIDEAAEEALEEVGLEREDD